MRQVWLKKKKKSVDFRDATFGLESAPETKTDLQYSNSSTCLLKDVLSETLVSEETSFTLITILKVLTEGFIHIYLFIAWFILHFIAKNKEKHFYLMSFMFCVAFDHIFWFVDWFFVIQNPLCENLWLWHASKMK